VIHVMAGQGSDQRPPPGIASLAGIGGSVSSLSRIGGTPFSSRTTTNRELPKFFEQRYQQGIWL
jgi:hypothetical protein